MKIIIESIPQGKHRYETLGDYWRAADGAVYIRVTEHPDWRYPFLIALHEMIEEAVTYHRGIAEKDIMAFDVVHPELDDPGMHPDAPYRKEHEFATAIEMLAAQQLGVCWAEYEKAMAAIIEKAPGE